MFEEFEGKTVVKGSERLVNAVKQIPMLLEAYYAKVASRIKGL